MIKFNALKRTIALMLAFVLCFSLFACGGNDDDDDTNNNDGDNVEFDPYPYDDLSVYMELPSYLGLTAEKGAIDIMIKSEINSLCSELDLYEEVSGRTVEDGDLVIINYVGMMNGETFEGGSAQNYDLLIGSGSFIEGFEAGIIGMSWGETKVLELKFPTSYYPDLAGKDVSFTVTVNKILAPATITDAICQEYTSFDTAEDFMAALTKDCLFDYLWQKLMSKCEVKQYPNTEYTEYYQYCKTTFTGYADQENMTLQEFLDEYGDYFYEAGIYSGMTVTEFEAVAQDYAKSQVVNDLLLYSIMRAEDIKTEGQEWEAAKAQLEVETGATYEELLDYYKDETVLIISVLNVRVKNIITASAQIVE